MFSSLSLLRGISREDIERGQVLCKPGSIHPHTKFTGQVYVLPSRIAKRRPSSIAIGVISSTSITTLSPGMHISLSAGSVITPVTSVVLKKKRGCDRAFVKVFLFGGSYLMKKDKAIAFLTIGFACILIVCVVIFVFLAENMNRQTSETMNQVGNIYMSSMNERLSMHFETTMTCKNVKNAISTLNTFSHRIIIPHLLKKVNS